MKPSEETIPVGKTPFEVMYWRPKRLSRACLWSGMIVSLMGMTLVQWWPAKVAPELQVPRKAAAEKAATAMRVIAQVQQQKGHRVVPKRDPQGSHLIGPSMSLVTSKLGSLESKQTSINPNFAAIVVQWLEEAGVKPGDRVAIGASGSWPGLNIAVYAAVETLQLKPTIILSAASSQYGANDPEMMWADMERELYDAGVISFRSVAGTFGGLYDRASGMPEPTRELISAALSRNAIPMLEATGLRALIQERIALYEHAIEGQSYAAYINVGGGSASIGGTAGNACFTTGVHLTAPAAGDLPHCVAVRMLAKQVPVINVVDAKSIAARYALSVAPVVQPPIGQGDALGKTVYRRSLAAVVMGATWLMMAIIVAPGTVLRPLGSWRSRRCRCEGEDAPEMMPTHVQRMV